ncbi:hypothetical protein BGY98DRAFT_994984 [Russula aff. rugulosa BPL654]|nr:hypothetical protein BGY98DRAFT_994984 [Russula aff. rugulosa BPL654]
MTEILMFYREKTVRQRLGQTVTVARAELFKATQKAKISGWGRKTLPSLYKPRWYRPWCSANGKNVRTI